MTTTTEYIDIVVRQRGAEQAGKAVEGIGTSADKTTKKIDSLNALLQTIGGSAAIYALARMANNYEQLNRKLTQFQTAARPASVILKDMVTLANETSASTDTTTRAFARLSLATQGSGIGYNKLKEIVSETQKLIALSGATTEEAAASMLQFSQAMSSGRLQGDEFRSLMENAPALMRTIAEGMGKPIGALKQMSAQGTLTADQILKSLQKMKDKVDESFSKLSVTPTQALQKLANNFEQSIGIIAKQTGLIDGVARAISFLAENAAIAGPVILGLAANFGVLLVRGGAVTKMLALMGITAETTWALILGPVGIVIAAVTGAVLAFDHFKDSVIEAGEKSATIGQIWEGIKGKVVDGFSQMVTAAGAFATKVGHDITEALGLSGISLKEFVNLVIGSFAALIGDIGDYLSLIPAGFKLAFDKSVQFVLQAIDSVTGAISKGVNSSIDLLNKLPGVNIAGRTSGTALSAGGYGDSALGFNDLLNQVNQQSQARLNDAGNTDYAGNGLRLLKTTADAAKGALVGLADTSKGTATSVSSDADNMAGHFQGVADKLTELQRLGKQFDKLGAPFEQAGAALKTLSELLDNHIISNEKFASSIEQVRLAFGRAGGTAQQFGKLMSDNLTTLSTKIQNSLVKGVQSIADGFVDLAVTGKANFADLTRSIIADMLKMVVQAQIVKPLLSFFGIAGFADGGAFSGGVQKFAAGGVFNTPHLFQFARGGAPSLGVLGEAGPEAILPLRRGQDGRLGVSAGGSGGGGGVVNQTNNLTVNMQGSSGDAQKDDAYIKKVLAGLQAQLDASIDQRMFDNMRYGGAFQPRGT